MVLANPSEAQDGSGLLSLVHEAFRAASRPGIDAGLWGPKEFILAPFTGLAGFWLEPCGVQMAQAKEYGSPVNGANTLFLLSQPAVNGGPIRCAESPVKRGSGVDCSTLLSAELARLGPGGIRAPLG
jgi:hypothetical protein